MKKTAFLFLIVFIPISCVFVSPAGDIRLVDTILDDQFVVSLAFENDGTAWVGIIRDQYGLIKYETDGSSVFYDHNNSVLLDSTNIWDIKIDSQGRVWMTNNGLVCLDNTEFTRYDTLSGIPAPVSSNGPLAIDSEDIIWFTGYNDNYDGSSQKIVSYNGNAFTVHEPSALNSCGNYLISDIEVDKDDNIWFSLNNYRGGLIFLKYNGSEWTSYDTSDIGFVPYRISDIEFDEENNLWFSDDYTFSSMAYHGTSSLYVFDGVNEATSVMGAGLVSVLSIDGDDNVWVTSLFERLKVYNSQKWAKVDNDLDISFCRVMQKAPNGDMCLGTSKGISIFRFLATK